VRGARSRSPVRGARSRSPVRTASGRERPHASESEPAIIRSVHARFYAPDAREEGELVALPTEEAQHLTRVLRLGRGAAVRVFNGRGAEFEAIVEDTTKDEACVLLGARRTSAPEPHVAVTLAQAVLKGDKMDDVVRDAVMMGAAVVQPLVTSRTEVSLPTLEKARKRERWERIAISSAKQCGRAVVPQIKEPLAFDTFIPTVAPLTLRSTVLMFVEPGAASEAIPLGALDSKPSAEAMIVVGPEGGWTQEEVAAGVAACRVVTLGERVLRADVMGVVGLAALFTAWKEF
jgi:16S rRNA (uracil1498-N3)-methyltransferase